MDANANVVVLGVVVLKVSLYSHYLVGKDACSVDPENFWKG